MTLDPIFDEMTLALRTELQEYGGLIVLLDDQQAAILHGDPEAFLEIGTAVHEQVTLLGAHRSCREKIVQHFARLNARVETSPLADLIPDMPTAVGGMIRALIEEINSLITRTKRRLRQNHLLLSRCLSNAQERVAAAGGGERLSTYGRGGAVKYVVSPGPARMAVA